MRPATVQSRCYTIGKRVDIFYHVEIIARKYTIFFFYRILYCNTDLQGHERSNFWTRPQPLYFIFRISGRPKCKLRNVTIYLPCNFFLSISLRLDTSRAPFIWPISDTNWDILQGRKKKCANTMQVPRDIARLV